MKMNKQKDSEVIGNSESSLKFVKALVIGVLALVIILILYSLLGGGSHS